MANIWRTQGTRRWRRCRLARLGLLALAAYALPGCSTGMEAAIETGSYALSGQEQTFKCNDIYTVIDSEIARIRQLPTAVRNQSEAAPKASPRC